MYININTFFISLYCIDDRVYTKYRV